MTMKLSIQLFSGRDFPPLDKQLNYLSSLGYHHVEPFAGLYEEPEALAANLQHAGLSAPSAHFGIELLENDYKRTLDIARLLGVEIVVVPFLLPDLRPDGTAGWKTFGERLARIARDLKRDGYRMAWHNHDFEFRSLEDGSKPIEHILDADPGIEWEADLAWVARSGEDPHAWLQRYADRVCAVHVKDIAPEGENVDEDGWADIGEGVLPWEKLWRVGRRTGAELMIAEHDKPSDFERFASAGIEAMQRLEKEA